MHPSHEELRRFCESGRDDAPEAGVAAHVRQCEFCQEFCEEYRALAYETARALAETLPARTQELADELHLRSLAGKIVPLKPFFEPEQSEPILLAADGQPEPESRIRNIATLCSEDPELVLRVMRDIESGRDFLQLIGESPELTAHVLVQAPELDLGLVTDNHGRAEIDGPSIADPDRVKWQIKMPEACFTLEPFDYDPERVEYSKEMTLETESNDAIEVRFEKRTEGRQVSVRVLKLEGRTDFGAISVAVSHGTKSHAAMLDADRRATFELTGPHETIDIRLFESE